jgi:hypothetical protein
VDILIIETSFHELLTVRNLSIGPDVNQHSFQFQFFFRIFFFDSDLLRTKKNQKCHKFYILIDFSGIRNLSSLNDLNSLSGLNELNSFISSKHLLSLNAGTKMTYPGLSMWDGSSKIHYIIDFWHLFSWRLWRPCYETNIKFEGQISKPNEYTDIFKSNLTCIFLSVRAKLKKHFVLIYWDRHYGRPNDCAVDIELVLYGYAMFCSKKETILISRDGEKSPKTL